MRGGEVGSLLKRQLPGRSKSHANRTQRRVATLFPCGSRTVFRVGGGEDDLGVARLEVGSALAEGDDLGRAHEGPGHGHEAQDEPLLGGCVLGEAQICYRVSVSFLGRAQACDNSSYRQRCWTRKYLRRCHRQQRCQRRRAQASGPSPWACRLRMPLFLRWR